MRWTTFSGICISRSMFEIFTENNQFWSLGRSHRFHLRSANDEILLHGKPYSSQVISKVVPFSSVLCCIELQLAVPFIISHSNDIRFISTFCISSAEAIKNSKINSQRNIWSIFRMKMYNENFLLAMYKMFFLLWDTFFLTIWCFNLAREICIESLLYAG